MQLHLSLTVRPLNFIIFCVFILEIAALLPSIKSAIDETLAGVTNLSLESSSQNNDDHQMDDETVQALIKSVHDGDVASIITLFKLQASLTVCYLNLPTYN
jgi:hypothetical protein